MKVASIGEVPPGSVKHILVRGKPVALCNVQGQFFAVNEICPHMGGPLSGGKLEGFILACPWHGWTFDVRTGQPDHPGGHSISTYEVKVEAGEIWVGWLKQ